MRNFLTLLMFLAVCNLLEAQITSGVAQYEVVSKSIEIEEDLPQLMKDILSDAGDDNGEMYFNTLSFNTQRSFSTYGKKKTEEEVAERLTYINIELSTSPDVCFDLENNFISYNTSFKDTSYQISLQYKFDNWEFTGQEEVINGYNCKEAILKHDFNIEKIIKRVWYTEEIPIPIGPAKFIGFPGLVISASGLGVEFTLIDIVEKNINVDCILEGVPISGDEMAAKKNASFKKWKDSFRKEKK